MAAWHTVEYGYSEFNLHEVRAAQIHKMIHRIKIVLNYVSEPAGTHWILNSLNDVRCEFCTVSLDGTQSSSSDMCQFVVHC